MYTPNCDVFSPGSYPHKNPLVPSRKIVKSVEMMLHWPQLPKRSRKERMIAQAVAAIEVEAKNKHGFPRGVATGWNATWRLLKNSRKGDVFKSQIAGPVTLFGKIHDQGASETELRRYIRLWLGHAYWQIDEIKDHGFKPLLVLDEPLLPTFMGPSGSPRARRVSKLVQTIVTRLQRRGALVGIHCCNRVSPTTLIGFGVDLIHFDAFYFPTQISRSRAELQKFLSQGGIIAWGIIPTDSSLTKMGETKLEKAFSDLLGTMESRGLPLRRVLAQSMVAPTCGTGQLTVEQSEKIMEFALTLSRGLKSRFKL